MLEDVPESGIDLEPYRKLKEKITKHNYNKLEALKFKMTLQLRNLRLLKDHDEIMRGIEKKQVGGQKRDNKIQNIQQISRLERDIERTAKQLRVEMDTIEMKQGDHTEQEASFLQDCDGLMNQAGEYFSHKEVKKMESLVKKDYTKINSKINTNLVQERQERQRQMQEITDP